jgi:hypothetical protein
MALKPDHEKELRHSSSDFADWLQDYLFSKPPHTLTDEHSLEILRYWDSLDTRFRELLDPDSKLLSTMRSGAS